MDIFRVSQATFAPLTIPLLSVRIRLLLIVGLAALTSGCAQFSTDGGMSFVSDVARQEMNRDVVALKTADDVASSRAVVDKLLASSLTADAAVQIALLNNRGLQAAFNDLAFAEAVMVGESLPPNPSISLSRIAGSAEVELDRQIIVSVLALATLPARSEIAAEKFRQAQLRAVWETLRIAADTRRAYYQAVAARELSEFLTQAVGAAETSAKLATRLGETGAMNKLDQAREQAFYAELAVQRATAKSGEAATREALIRAMGVWGSDLEFRLPNTLPPLPKRVQALANIEAEAVRRRVDLQISRMEVDALAKAYGLTQATRFINVLDAGYADKITRDKATGQRTKDRGFDVAFEIPIFDFGEVRVREAEATYMGSVNRLLQRAVNVRSEARAAYQSYRSTYDVANHYTREVLPLRKIISEEAQLRYNGMLIDVFDLLLEARQRITVNLAAIAMRREFWLASTNLTTAVVGGGLSGPAEVAFATTSTSGAAGD